MDYISWQNLNTDLSSHVGSLKMWDWAPILRFIITRLDNIKEFRTIRIGIPLIKLKNSLLYFIKAVEG